MVCLLRTQLLLRSFQYMRISLSLSLRTDSPSASWTTSHSSHSRQKRKFPSLSLVLQSANSMVLVQMVLLVPTRTPSKSSVTIHLNTARDISTMTPRNQADIPAHTSVSETPLSRLHILSAPLTSLLATFLHTSRNMTCLRASRKTVLSF